jgi:competence protein ComEC
MLVWMFAFALGVAIALWQSNAASVVWISAGLMGGFCLWALWVVKGHGCLHRATRGVWIACSAISGVLLGWGWTQWQVLVLNQTWASQSVQRTETVQVQGIIDSLPQHRAGIGQWILAVEKIRHEGREWQTSNGMRIRVSDRTGLEVQAAQRWQMVLRLKPLHVAMNPGLNDGHVYAVREGLVGQGQVVDTAFNRSVKGATTDRWILGVRQWLMQRLQQHVPASEAQALMVALLIGEQGAIDAEEWEVYRRTGIAHLISVSGMHVTLFAWLAQKVLGGGWRWLGQRIGAARRVDAPKVGLWAGMALALFYAHVAGWGVPAQRTWMMLAIFSVLRSLKRPWPWPVVWAATLVGVLAWDPWALWSAGLWLSFVAVAMLLTQVEGEVPWNWTWLQMLRYGASVLRMQLLMTFALAPLTAWLMGQVSLLGLVANLFAVPWITFGVLPLTFLGVLITPCWTLAERVAQGLIDWLSWISAAPTGAWMVSVPPWWLVLWATAGMVLASLPGPVVWRLWAATWVLPWLLWRAPLPDWGQFRVVAWEIGQGSALWIQTRHHGLIYDTAASYPSGGSAAQSVMVPSLKAQGLIPDAVVLSHADNDHAGGWPHIQQAWPDVRLWTSFNLPQATPCLAGTTWDWDGVRFRFIYPSLHDLRSDQLDDNDRSCVLHVQALNAPYGSMMLSGDAGVSVEDRLVDMQDLSPVDLMVAGHHGSHTSSGVKWMQALRPLQVWVQAGHDNRYGHPHTEVTQRWDLMNIPWWATPHTGALHFDSAQPWRTESERERRKRSWHPQAHLPMSRN